MNDKFEYYEEIDLTDFVEQVKGANPDDNKYQLFSVLVHEGKGSSQGHYYAFIRPELKRWYKFNDHRVTPAQMSEAMEGSFGGSYR